MSLATAKRIATLAHQGQVRKYPAPGAEPSGYICHPMRVADAVSAYSDEMIAAAWLHDVFEDCDPQWRNAVAEECGAGVYCLVHELTNPSKGLTCHRAMRKEIDRHHIRRLSEPARIIKIFDRTDNLMEMTYAPTSFLKVYLDESFRLRDILIDDGNENLVEHKLDAALMFVMDLIRDREAKGIK